MKYYVLIDKISSKVAGAFCDYNSDGRMDPPVDPDHWLVAIPDEHLEGTTFEELMAAKTPVVSGDPLEVTGWTVRPSQLIVKITQDVPAQDDASNEVTISLEGGPTNVDFACQPSRPIACSLPGCSGQFDGSGDASFTIKVFGQGPLAIRITAEGASEAIHEVSVVSYSA